MGLEEEISSEEEDAPPEEGFLEMMEGLGFDRRTVLSPEKPERPVILKKRSVDYQRNLDQGHQWYKEGQYDKAIEEFEKVVQVDPDSVEASQCLGDSFFRMGQLEKAKEAYERVRQLDPENVNVLENLGVIFANQGDYKKAVWQWGEVLKRNPDRRDIITRIKKMQRVIRQRYL
jgi:Flp pilus assembly protein TadD